MVISKGLVIKGIISMGYTRLGLTDTFIKPIGFGLLVCEIKSDTTIEITSRFRPHYDGDVLMVYGKSIRDLSEPTDYNEDIIVGDVDDDVFVAFVVKRIAYAEVECETNRVIEKKNYSKEHRTPFYLKNVW